MSAHGIVLCRLLKAHRPRVGAEVGVYRGETSAQLLRTFPGLHLHMIDQWQVPLQESDWVATGDPCSRYCQAVYDEHRHAAHAATRFAANRRTVWHMPSVEAAEQLPLLDFAFIDGDHSESGCLADIQAYWPKIRPGGVLFGHDWWPSYNATNRHTVGVRRAVKSFFRSVKVAASGVWWVQQGTGSPTPH